MAVADRRAPRPARIQRSVRHPPERATAGRGPVRPATVAPTLLAAAFAAAYVIVSPPSLDLAAHLFRAQLFRREGFGVWNNFWYSGHHILGYSVLFPAVSAALTPQLAGALAAALTTIPFTLMARRHVGDRALAGTLLFGAFTATDLFTGRLAFAFGALPAMIAVDLLDRGWWPAAGVFAVVSALCSPVAALFLALIAAGYALGGALRARPWRAAICDGVVFVGAVAPVAVVSFAFPEGGSEPFGVLTMLPVLVAAGGALLAVDRDQVTLRACLAVYTVAVAVAFVVPSPVGSNVARLGTLLAAPLAVTLLWNRRPRLLALGILPLLYIGWQAPIRDLSTSSGDRSTSTAYYRPLLRFLDRRSAPPASPFRIEIPFTRFHWEADVVASHAPIARGWERQLDVHDNPIFYRPGQLTAASYRTWLRDNAVRYVAVPDAELDYSGRAEAALVASGLPYLHLVDRTAHWRVYRVAEATPIAVGARLTGLGADWLSLTARHAGSVTVHVRFTPYWKITRGAGCVEPDGQDTRLVLRRSGAVRLAATFAFSRIGARSPRCS